MLSIVPQFYAMAPDFNVHLCGDTAESRTVCCCHGSEVRRIEIRYSRYRDDSELTRINEVAATGGSVGIDAETAGFIDHAKACFTKSGGAFDSTAGLLSGPAPADLLPLYAEQHCPVLFSRKC